MSDLTHLSLFTGIGGIDLAAEWAGFRTVGQCEFADYPTKVLEKHWPDVLRWRDVRDVTRDSIHKAEIGEITLLSGGFLANRTVAQGNALLLTMSAICGANLHESFAKLDQDGCWERMYQGCSQVRMDGFSDEFLETWPAWGTMQAGECFLLSPQEDAISASDVSLLPTPCAVSGLAWSRTRKSDVLPYLKKLFGQSERSIHTVYFLLLSRKSAKEAAQFLEMMMGFPLRWTE